MTNQYNTLRFFFQLLVLSIIWSSCTSSLYVAPKQADCKGSSDQKCFLIRKNLGENWILHYYDIKGFDYQPGFSYKLKVKKENVKNPPLKASTFNFKLVEILEMTDVTDDIDLEDLANKVWKLEYLKLNRVEVGIEKIIPTIEFEMESKVSGFGGCNEYNAGFSLDGRIIKIGEIGSTKMLCPQGTELESNYFEVLNMEMQALFSEGKLMLTGEGGNQLIFGYK